MERRAEIGGRCATHRGSRHPVRTSEVSTIRSDRDIRQGVDVIATGLLEIEVQSRPDRPPYRLLRDRGVNFYRWMASMYRSVKWKPLP